MSKETRAREDSSDQGKPERDIIRRAVAGDDEAYAALIRMYQARIFNLISRLVGRADVVDDLAQEVFIKAYMNISNFREESSFYTWIYAIALNTCRNYYRSRKAMSKAVSLDDENAPAVIAEGGDALPEEVVMRRQRAMLVRKALDRLPEEQKEIVVMCDLEGLSYQEIAAILGLPVGTVRSRIFRARAHLRELLADTLGEGTEQ